MFSSGFDSHDGRWITLNFLFLVTRCGVQIEKKCIFLFSAFNLFYYTYRVLDELKDLIKSYNQIKKLMWCTYIVSLDIKAYRQVYVYVRKFTKFRRHSSLHGSSVIGCDAGVLFTPLNWRFYFPSSLYNMLHMNFHHIFDKKNRKMASDTLIVLHFSVWHL